MPKALERKLKAQAKKRGLKGERAGAYVYGNAVMKSYSRKKRRG